MRYIKIHNDVGTINVQGEWTLLESHDIEEEIGEAYGKGINNYIIDFAGTDTIDYASILDAVDHREHAPLLDPGTRGGSVKDPWGKEYEYHVNDDKISGHIICSEGGSGNTTVQF